MVKAADSEDDSAQIDELLAELEEKSNSGSLTTDTPSRYDELRVLLSSNDAAHAKIQSHTNFMHTEETKGSPFLQASDQEETKGSPLLQASDQEDEEEKARDAPHTNVGHADVAFRDDVSKCASIDMPHTSPANFTHPCEMRRLAVDKLPSPPPSPPSFGCSCFFLPSPKRVQKQRKFSKGEFRSSKSKAEVHKANAIDDDKNDEWGYVSSEIRPGEVDYGGLFDVKKTEKEFKRVSLKEKQLSKEAQKLLDMIASS